jgi:hypothetical protein
MINLKSFTPYFLSVFFLVGCNSNLPKVDSHPFEMTIKSAGKINGVSYSTKATIDAPVLYIFDKSQNAIKNWNTTSKHFAQAEYNVIVADLSNFSLDSLSTLQQLSFSINAQNSNSKNCAVIGVGPCSNAAIKIAARDTTVKAFITLDAAHHLSSNVAAYFSQIPPRPFLFIEPTQNPQNPEIILQNVFESAGDPKKSVWLATHLKDSEILNSDLEPIVRRTVLLLVDRYLKGKM